MLAGVRSTLFDLGGSAKLACAVAAAVEPHTAEPSSEGLPFMVQRKRALWLCSSFRSELSLCRHAPV